MIRVARCRFSFGERGAQLGPIGALAAFDLGIVGDDLPAGAAYLAGDRFALSVEAKTRSALTIGAGAVVRHKAGRGRGRHLTNMAVLAI